MTAGDVLFVLLFGAFAFVCIYLGAWKLENRGEDD